MKKILIYSFIAFTLLSGTSVVRAQNTYTLLEPLPCIEGIPGCSPTTKTLEKIEINQYISYVFKFAIAIAVFLATVMIIWGGFEYMLSEAITSKSDAKKRINNAIYGLGAALLSYLILQTIDPRLVQINTQIQPICNTENSRVGSGGACDTKGFQDLQTALNNDLKDMGKEIREQVINEEVQIKELEKQKLDLVRLMKDPEQNTYDNTIKLHNLDDKLSAAKASQGQKIYTGLSVSSFRTALATVNDVRTYTKDARFEDGSLIRNSGQADTTRITVDAEKEKIKAKYEEYAKVVGNSPAQLQQMEKERDFFLSEIDLQRKVVQNAIAYTNSRREMLSSNPGFEKVVKKYLEDQLAVAQKEGESLSKSEGLGLDDEYRTITESRIKIIQDALKFAPK